MECLRITFTPRPIKKSPEALFQLLCGFAAEDATLQKLNKP